jgi:hypothetical protein
MQALWQASKTRARTKMSPTAWPGAKVHPSWRSHRAFSITSAAGGLTLDPELQLVGTDPFATHELVVRRRSARPWYFTTRVPTGARAISCNMRRRSNDEAPERDRHRRPIGLRTHRRCSGPTAQACGEPAVQISTAPRRGSVGPWGAEALDPSTTRVWSSWKEATFKLADCVPQSPKVAEMVSGSLTQHLVQAR